LKLRQGWDRVEEESQILMLQGVEEDFRWLGLSVKLESGMEAWLASSGWFAW